MIARRYPYYLANKPCNSEKSIEVRDKFSGQVVSSVAAADGRAVDEAIARATQLFRGGEHLAAYRRREIIEHCIMRFEEHFDAFAQVLCVEAGKPIRDARAEVLRLIDTFRVASGEVFHAQGEVLPMDITERSQQYSGMWRRVPIGPCAFISPFNFPLNLVAHKIAPALAVGNPFVLKPASRTPIGALLVGKILSECDLPEGYFSILPSSRADAEQLVTDDRIKLLSFTGSHAVGWDMKARAGKKKVLLELGGNAACIVDEDASLEDAVARLISGIFYQSGQSCISVQRVYIHEGVYEVFRERLVAAAKALVVGDPKQEDTFIGPMIAESEAERLERWIQRAVEGGARVLCGGGRQGALFEATLLEGVSRKEELYRSEAFGPVAVLESVRSFDEALARTNDSEYGLQAGVFTRDVHKVLEAWKRIEVGGVIINDVPSWRVDHMPYGGVKDSGNTREGIRFSMEEMTEIRLLVIRHNASS